MVLDDLLLDAKLLIPQPRSGAVSRGELIESARASDFRVVGVTAPAGYGKSTLLLEWARAEDRPVAWVSLDRFDDDPSVLVTLLASAYARIAPGDADLVAGMGGHGVSVLGRAAPRLASVLRASPVPFVIMLDDLHELQSPACHDVLSVVISGIPRGSQLVAASRFEQPHLPRLRASGDAREFLASDLALDASGAERIFTEARVRVSPEVAAAVAERTEGWPVGIYLAAVIASDGDGEALAISGDDRYVADYLYRESLAHLPESSRHFLRCTAVLDQLCAPLCDALLGEPGAQEQLRGLEASSTFLIPLDRRREWYRYHALFREFLLGEQRRVEPALIPKLHLRAADWYEANGSPALALEHLLNTSERDRCVQLVTALALPTYQAGQMSTLQRWLAALGDAAIEEYPPLAVLAGWAAALTGQTVDAERWAAILDAASFDLVPADGSASFESARAMLRAMMCASGPEQALADASFAVSEEPPWSAWRDQALALAGEAHLLVGDPDQAEARFVESVAAADGYDNADVIVLGLSELAVLAMDDGRWTEAVEHLDRALAAIDDHRMYDYATSVLAFAGAARLAVHRGDLDEASRQLTQAMRGRPACTFALPFVAVRVRLQLAKVHRAIGDHTTARHLLREVDDVLLHRPALGRLVDEVSEFRRSLTSGVQVGATGGSPLTPAELRLLPYLQTHLTIGEIAGRVFVSRNTVSTQVGSIYRKLGVSSRNDAVEQATAIGLLGG
jgi:LuxR family maltose regulon positive regulatory protein